MRKLGWGLVGYGAWGICHARAIQKAPGCKLRAVCTRTVEGQHRATADCGAIVSRDFREMVARPDIDIVDVVVPNDLHELVACAALESGKHVLLEKPMSISVDSCDRIIQAAQAAKRVLLVGHEMRFSATYIQIRELIRSGQIGDPRYMLIDLWRRPYRRGSDGWRMVPSRVGNWILEEPVHYFDAAAWFLDCIGSPSTMFARGNLADLTKQYQPEVIDNFTAIMGYANGTYVVLSQTLAAVEHHLSMKIFGSKALIRAEWHGEIDRSADPIYSLEISEGGALKKLAVAETPGESFELRAEIAALARSIRDEVPLPIVPEEGRNSVMLCLEAQRSLETGLVVCLA